MALAIREFAPGRLPRLDVVESNFMNFRAEDYYKASLERIKQARKSYSDKDGDSFALSMYCAGLAVESLLRAFRWTDDSSFEGRHDLNELLKASRLLKIEEDYMRRKGKSDDEIRTSTRKIRVSMDQIVRLWHNNFRFASEARALAFVKQAGIGQRVKGDPLKSNAHELLEAAQTIVDRGVVLWTSKRKS